ncbi:foldase protein PrsA precursor [Desulfocucumis palustris]|uniref:peptidylprolyl isomerase n=1 Tax=Desulfocucumis palustris TaxID=1898651 RepID=A0A2L2XEA2_9FIRM|nr:peptidylprolyl isomerase [Desulfocucumis palustris]GBF32161.1 foldase protein PrsA precursor [Desulfocucumis palustris]
MSRKFQKLILPVLLIFSVILAGCGSNVAATVNGQKITSQQLDEQVTAVKEFYKQQGMNLEGPEAAPMLEMLKGQVLENMINQELVYQEAKKQGINPSKKDLEKQVADLKAGFKDEAEYKRFLAANGISEPKLYDLVERDFMAGELQKKVTADVKEATEEDALKYYQGNKGQYTIPAQYEVRHILLSTMDKPGGQAKVEADARTAAMSVLSQLSQGKDFAALAKEKSEDYGSASNGGLYTFKKGEAVKEFEEAALALKPGEYTKAPVKTDFGYHIIKMEKIIPESITPFEQVKSEIMASLTQKAKEEKFTKYMTEVAGKATIVNNLNKGKEDTKKKE